MTIRLETRWKVGDVSKAPDYNGAKRSVERERERVLFKLGVQMYMERGSILAWNVKRRTARLYLERAKSMSGK